MMEGSWGLMRTPGCFLHGPGLGGPCSHWGGRKPMVQGSVGMLPPLPLQWGLYMSPADMGPGTPSVPRLERTSVDSPLWPGHADLSR